MCRDDKPKGGSFLWLLKKVHEDEEGGVSIETVLIIAAIALPILIFVVKFAWPQIKQYFIERQNELLEDGADPEAAGA